MSHAVLSLFPHLLVDFHDTNMGKAVQQNSESVRPKKYLTTFYKSLYLHWIEVELRNKL